MPVRSRRLALLVVSVCLVLLTAGGVLRLEEWVIDRFNADIAIQADGSLLINERIDVDFLQLTDRRGIFRDIPVRYAWPEDPEKQRIYRFRVLGVTNAQGQPWQYEVSEQGAFERIRIGNPEVRVRGKQTYVISYTIGGALNPFPDHDELFWNINGDQWPVPTTLVSATVRSGVSGIGRVTCFQGATGSTQPCQSNSGPAQAQFQTTRAMPSGSGLTVVVAVAKGLIQPAPTPILVPAPGSTAALASFLLPSPFTAIGALLVLVGGLLFVISTWWRHGRDVRYQRAFYTTGETNTETAPMGDDLPVVVEYTPPDGWRPGLMGVIVDERADTIDVTATIVDLAVRGYLTIAETGADGVSGLFGGKDWELRLQPKGVAVVDTQQDGELAGWEATVLRGLFDDGHVVEMSDLKRKFHVHLAQAQNELLQDATGRGWFRGNPKTVRAVWAAGSTVIIVIAGLLGVFGTILIAPFLSTLFNREVRTEFPWIALALGIVGLVSLVLSGSMAQRTASGSEALRRTLGFRRYIETAETHRQEFNEKANIFAEYLPYAIVFGLVSKWSNAFRDIDLEPYTRGWYVGTGPFYFATFASSMTSFTSDAGSTLASTPGSSGGSGFGGGGFSGGGGGGGGGGSW